MTKWRVWGKLAFRLDKEDNSIGFGIRINWEEPAIDLFFLFWMVGVTSVKHMTWIVETNLSPVQ